MRSGLRDLHVSLRDTSALGSAADPRLTPTARSNALFKSSPSRISSIHLPSFAEASAEG